MQNINEHRFGYQVEELFKSNTIPGASQLQKASTVQDLYYNFFLLKTPL